MELYRRYYCAVGLLHELHDSDLLKVSFIKMTSAHTIMSSV